MLTVHTVAFYIHIVIGSIALIVFWLPVFARKGSAFHKRAGRWFANSMYAVAATALIMAVIVLIDPIGIRHPERDLAMEEAFSRGGSIRLFALFLLMLAVLVFVSVRHSILVLQARQNRAWLRHPLHLSLQVLLGLLGLLVGYFGIANGQLLLIIFASISVLGASGMLRYSFKDELTRNEWWIEHLSNIIGGGIGAYTAFFAFGGSRLLANILSGQWQVVAWIMPPLIGAGFINYLSRHYRGKFARLKEQHA